MYDNGNGPLVNAGYVSLTGVGVAAGFMYQILLSVTIMFTLFVLYRIVMRTVRTSQRSS